MTPDQWLAQNTTHCHRLDARISPARCKDIRERKNAYDPTSRSGCQGCPQAEQMDKMAAGELPIQREEAVNCDCGKPAKVKGKCQTCYARERYQAKKEAARVKAKEHFESFDKTSECKEEVQVMGEVKKKAIRIDEAAKEQAIRQAKRFIALAEMPDSKSGIGVGNKMSGAANRASMDLTRALARYRKPENYREEIEMLEEMGA